MPGEALPAPPSRKDLHPAVYWKGNIAYRRRGEGEKHSKHVDLSFQFILGLSWLEKTLLLFLGKLTLGEKDMSIRTRTI